VQADSLTSSASLVRTFGVNMSVLTSSSDGVIDAMDYQQSEGHISGLMGLPTEIAVHIMRQVPQPLMLSMACQKLRAIYQEPFVYSPDERQHHSFAYTLAQNPATTRALREKLTARNISGLILPAPQTLRWYQLLNHPLERLSWQDQVKKTYITVRNVLLHPQLLTLPQAVELMRLVTDLANYFPESKYGTKLFHEGFSWDIFSQLANIHLESCLQLVAVHFPLEKGSLSYEFCVKQCAPLGNQQDDRFARQFPPIIDELISPLQRTRFALFLIKRMLENWGEREVYEELFYFLLKRGCNFQSAQASQEALYLILEYRPTDESDEQRYLNYRDIEYKDLFICKLFNLLLTDGVDCNAEYGRRYPLLVFLLRYSYIESPDRLKLLALLLLQQATLDVNALDVNAINPKNEENALGYLIGYDFKRRITQLEVTKALLQHPKLNPILDKREASALYFAIEKDEVATVSSLLAHASIELELRVGAFLYALWRKKDEIAHLFLQTSGDEEAKQELVDQALARAIGAPKDEFRELVPILLQYGADCYVEGETQETALLTACRHEQQALVEWLLQQPDIDVNTEGAPEDDARFPLFIAIEKNNLTLLKLLLQHPDIEINKATSITLTTAVTCAAELSRSEALVLFAQYMFNQTPIEYRKLTDIFFDIISVAPYCNRTDTKKDELLNTFLQSMSPTQKEAFIHYVLNFMIKPNKRGSYEGRLTKAVPVLLQHGVDCNTRNDKGESVLMIACEQRAEALVKLLLQQPNINVNTISSEGKSALHCAINQGSVAIVQLLLDSNKIMDFTRLQTFNYAIDKGQNEIANLLRLP
jgi:ankyrin repeat protein